MSRPRLVAVGGGSAPVPLPAMGQQTVAVAQPMQVGGAAPAQAAQVRSLEVTQLEAAVPEAFNPAQTLAPVAAPPPSLPPRSTGGLFTEAPRPAAPAPASAHRPSIFGRVTGSWRRSAEPEQVRAEPQMQEAVEPTVVVRQAAPDSEAQGLDIPAFLRRQSN